MTHQVADFLSRCVTAKGAMGRDVLEQLQVGGMWHTYLAGVEVECLQQQDSCHVVSSG